MSWRAPSRREAAVPAIHRILVLALLIGSGAQAACPPAGQTRESLQALKAAQWRLAGEGAEAAREALSLGLLDCLADPDPLLRDAIAFEALSAWMRARQLSVATLQEIRARLMAVLAEPPDAAGFRQPFAALALAEVARVDRLQPFLAADERAALVERGTRYLAGVRDYRGHDARDGWRHGVAHAADLMLQLSLNPQLQRAQAEAMLEAIAAQAMPAGEHFYRYGEPDRLMTPVFYLGRRGWWQAEDWQAWFDALIARRTPGGATTEAGLAQRHNLGAFLAALYVAVQEQADDAMKQRLLPGLRKALKALG
jgi:Protein of unknown function (DUF2785)